MCEPGTAVGTNGCTVQLPLYTDPATGKTGRVDGVAAGVRLSLSLCAFACVCTPVCVCVCARARVRPVHIKGAEGRR